MVVSVMGCNGCPCIGLSWLSVYWVVMVFSILGCNGNHYRQRDRHHFFKSGYIPKTKGGQIYLNFVRVMVFMKFV